MEVVSGLVAIAATFIGCKTLVASTRAWVGPINAEATLTGDGAVTMKIVYQNAGKEPAQNFGDDWADHWAAKINPTTIDNADFFYNGCVSDGRPQTCAERAGNWQHEKCADKNVFQDRIAFPDFSYSRRKPGLKVDPADTDRIVVVQGCFVYRSDVTFFEPVHRTAFCYHYRVGQVDTEMRACPVGNFAT